MKFNVILLTLLVASLFSAESSPAQVSIGPVSGGTLVEAGSSGNRLESSSSGEFTVTLGSLTPSASVQISSPTFVSGSTSDPLGTTRTATANIDGTIITSDNPSVLASLSIGSTTVLVDMQVERPTSFPAGTYQYAVSLTVIPD